MLLTMVASHSKQAAAVLHAPANFRIIAWTRHLLAPEIQVGRPHPRASPHPMTSPSAKDISIIKHSEKKKKDLWPARWRIRSGGWKRAQRKVAQVWNCLECSQAGTDTIKEKESWTGDTSQSRKLMQLEKKELVQFIKKLEQDTADR